MTARVRKLSRVALGLVVCSLFLGCSTSPFGWLWWGESDQSVVIKHEDRPELLNRMKVYLNRRSPALTFLDRYGDPDYVRVINRSTIELYYIDLDQVYLFANEPVGYGAISPTGPIPEEVISAMTREDANRLSDQRKRKGAMIKSRILEHVKQFESVHTLDSIGYLTPAEFAVNQRQQTIDFLEHQVNE